MLGLLRKDVEVLLLILIKFQVATDTSASPQQFKGLQDSQSAVIHGRSHAGIDLLSRLIQASHRKKTDAVLRERPPQIFSITAVCSSSGMCHMLSQPTMKSYFRGKFHWLISA